ncbi:MAG: hypothetical protein MHPSP_001376, partial [Paramarteilia canceri]
NYKNGKKNRLNKNYSKYNPDERVQRINDQKQSTTPKNKKVFKPEILSRKVSNLEIDRKDDTKAKDSDYNPYQIYFDPTLVNNSSTNFPNKTSKNCEIQPEINQKLLQKNTNSEKPIKSHQKKKLNAIGNFLNG